VDGVLVVGQGVVGGGFATYRFRLPVSRFRLVAGDDDREEVVDAGAPDIGVEDGASFVGIRDAMNAVVDVADGSLRRGGGGATAEGVVGVRFGRDAVGGDGDELVEGVPGESAVRPAVGPYRSAGIQESVPSSRRGRRGGNRESVPNFYSPYAITGRSLSPASVL
jgi:hypothetical protein